MSKQISMQLFATVVGVLCVVASSGQSIFKSDQIFVRTYEMFPHMGMTYDSEIVISYGEERSEKIKLGNFKDKNREFNTFTINKVLNNIRKAGYKLLSSNAAGVEGSYICSYVFVRTEGD